MQKKFPTIYLASQSPRRREILKGLRIGFRVVESSYKESSRSRLSPEQLVLVHSEGKARKAKVPATARWVLGADTVVVVQKEILGKPKTPIAAMKMLDKLSGRSHQVLTGLVLWDKKENRMISNYDVTRVFIRRLSRRAKEHYILQIHPYDKAGGYAIQLCPKIVRKITGSYSNVMGFPKELFRKMLRTAFVAR